MIYEHARNDRVGDGQVQHEVLAGGEALLVGYIIASGTSRDQAIEAFLEFAVAAWNQTEGEAEDETQSE